MPAFVARLVTDRWTDVMCDEDILFMPAYDDILAAVDALNADTKTHGAACLQAFQFRCPCILSDDESLSSVSGNGGRQLVTRDASVEWLVHAAFQPPASSGRTSFSGPLQSHFGAKGRLFAGTDALRRLEPSACANGDIPGRWPWSSYHFLLGQEPAPEWLDTDWLLSQFGRIRGESIRAYYQFVLAGLGLDSPLKATSHQLILGDDVFVGRHRKLSSTDPLRDVSRAQRRALALSLKEYQILYPDDEEAMRWASHISRPPIQ
jgi:hypothetical protein